MARTYLNSLDSPGYQGADDWGDDSRLHPVLHQFLGLVCFLALSFATAGIGGIASMNAAEFYASLLRPDWAPPAALFGPVWSVLYTLMGIAGWLVWRERGTSGARTPLLLFVIQLGLNALWSWVFFAWHEGSLAFLEIASLWLLIGATAVSFYRVRPLAAVLLIPYFAWVGFATALTLALWQMNPAVLG